jgi:hypothetical protein
MSSRNHPMQPLSPKHQPWFRTQAPDRNLASAYMSRSPVETRLFGAPAQTVEQELVLRARIEQRSAEKLEKLHEAVNHDRFVRVSSSGPEVSLIFIGIYIQESIALISHLS